MSTVGSMITGEMSMFDISKSMIDKHNEQEVKAHRAFLQRLVPGFNLDEVDAKMSDTQAFKDLPGNIATAFSDDFPNNMFLSVYNPSLEIYRKLHGKRGEPTDEKNQDTFMGYCKMISDIYQKVLSSEEASPSLKAYATDLKDGFLSRRLGIDIELRSALNELNKASAQYSQSPMMTNLTQAFKDLSERANEKVQNLPEGYKTPEGKKEITDDFETNFAAKFTQLTASTTPWLNNHETVMGKFQELLAPKTGFVDEGGLNAISDQNTEARAALRSRSFEAKTNMETEAEPIKRALNKAKQELESAMQKARDSINEYGNYTNYPQSLVWTNDHIKHYRDNQAAENAS